MGISQALPAMTPKVIEMSSGRMSSIDVSLPAGELVPPDWSQFIPDTISSLATSAVVGLIVGLLLWRWQTGSERRVLRRIALADWKTKRPRVGNAVAPVVNRGISSDNLPLHVSFYNDVLKEGQSMPIGEWTDAAPDSEELRAFAGLVVDLPTLMRFATDLTQMIDRALLRDGLVMEGHQTPFARWTFAAVLEVPDPGRAVGDTHDQYGQIGATVLAFPDVAAKVDEFRSLLAKVEGNYTKLQSALSIGI